MKVKLLGKVNKTLHGVVAYRYIGRSLCVSRVYIFTEKVGENMTRLNARASLEPASYSPTKQEQAQTEGQPKGQFFCLLQT